MLDVSACVGDHSGDTGRVAVKKSAAKKTVKKPTAKKAAVKNVGGRPARAGKAATTGLFIRLTEAEREALAAGARKAGKPLAAFVRDAAVSSLKSS